MSEASKDPLVITRDGGVVLVRMNRPEVLNALSSKVMTDLAEALKPLDRDPGVGCIVPNGVRIRGGDAGVVDVAPRERPATASEEEIQSLTVAA